MDTDRETRNGGTVQYRLEVAGPVGASWAGWFEADAVTRRGENTVLEVRVQDQSDLYGRLRRIHDLNLRLISVTLVAPGTPEAGPAGETRDMDTSKEKTS